MALSAVIPMVLSLPPSLPPSLPQIHALQRDALALGEAISSGLVGLDDVEVGLSAIQDSHAHLVSVVADAASNLDRVNECSGGRAARLIASRHTTLRTEVGGVGGASKFIFSKWSSTISGTSQLRPPPDRPEVILIVRWSYLRNFPTAFIHSIITSFSSYNTTHNIMQKICSTFIHATGTYVL